MDINRIRRLAGLQETELNMGLPPEALAELDACLREAMNVLKDSVAYTSRVQEFAPLIPEQQARVERIAVILTRLSRLDRTPKAVRAELLDDTITALMGFEYIFIPLAQVFDLPAETKAFIKKMTQTRSRCYSCLKVVGVGWGD